MSRLSRLSQLGGPGGLLGLLLTTAIGALLAGAYLVGGSTATRSTAPEPRPPGDAAPAETLALDDYCRYLHGARAAAYQPVDLSGWRCSVWRNGVWGLELVDLSAACHWQRGPDAVLKQADLGPGTTDRELLCTM